MFFLLLLAVILLMPLFSLCFRVCREQGRMRLYWLPLGRSFCRLGLEMRRKGGSVSADLRRLLRLLPGLTLKDWYVFASCGGGFCGEWIISFSPGKLLLKKLRRLLRQ